MKSSVVKMKLNSKTSVGCKIVAFQKFLMVGTRFRNGFRFHVSMSLSSILVQSLASKSHNSDECGFSVNSPIFRGSFDFLCKTKKEEAEWIQAIKIRIVECVQTNSKFDDDDILYNFIREGSSVKAVGKVKH